MPKKILEFHTHCKGCDTKIPVALMRGDKLICPKCGAEVKEGVNVDINFTLIKYFILGMMPWHWLRNHFTDNAWDKTLNDLLDDPNTKIRHYHYGYNVIINDDILVWVANYPYAYGDYYGTKKDCGFGSNGLPKRSTCVRLKEIVDNLPMRGKQC